MEASLPPSGAREERVDRRLCPIQKFTVFVKFIKTGADGGYALFNVQKLPLYLI